MNLKLLRGKAFVKFTTEKGLIAAIALNGSDCCGRRIRVEAAGSSAPQGKP
jgi:RNA recognition motif-containing protein